MAQAADGCHQAGDRAANPWVAASGQRAVIRHRLGEAHRDTGAHRCGHSDQESLPGLMRGESRGEQGRERRNRAVHQTGKARLHDLEHEHPVARLLLLLRAPCRSDATPSAGAPGTRDHVRRRPDRQAIYVSRHRWSASSPARRTAASHIPVPRPGAAPRPAPAAAPAKAGDGARSRYIMRPDQGNVLAELFPIERDEMAAMLVFLLGQFDENLSRGRESSQPALRHSHDRCARAPPPAKLQARESRGRRAAQTAS